MPILTLNRIDDYLFFDEDECRAAGRKLAADYQNADPFPHIVLDELIDPAILRSVAARYPSLEGQTFFDRDQERFKYQFKPEAVPSGLTRNLPARPRPPFDRHLLLHRVR